MFFIGDIVRAITRQGDDYDNVTFMVVNLTYPNDKQSLILVKHTYYTTDDHDTYFFESEEVEIEHDPERLKLFEDFTMPNIR